MLRTPTQVYAYTTGSPDQFRIVYVPIDEAKTEIPGKREEEQDLFSWNKITGKFLITEQAAKHNDLIRGNSVYLCDYDLID